MNFKKILLGLGIIVCLSGGVKLIDAMGDYYDQFPNVIVKLQPSISLENADDYVYPRKVQVHYHLPIDSPLLNEEVVYAFTGSDTEYWKISVLKETEEGYVVELGEDDVENFLIEDPNDFGFKGYLEAESLNGTFEMTFYSEKGMTSFFSELEGNGEWYDTYLYMKERGAEDESSNEKIN